LRAVDHLKESAEKKVPVNLEDVCLNYCMDNIARLVYSMDVNAIGNPNNEFSK